MHQLEAGLAEQRPRHAARADQPWADVRAVVAALARVVDHPLECAAPGAHPLDGRDLLAQSQNRLDLERRAQPCLCGPDPAALAEVLERVDREPHLQLVAGAFGRRERAGAVLASLRSRGRSEDHHGLAAAGGAAVVDLDALAALSLRGQSLLRLRRGLAGAGDPGGEVDGDDVPALGQRRLVDGAEVTHRWLRGRRTLGAGAQALEELGVVGPRYLDLRPLLAVERDV